MSDAAEQPVPALDTKTLLARINARIVLLRQWLSHDHHDEPYWWARRMTVPRAQSERLVLRRLANLLHIERATTRGRMHGTWFKNLDEQRAWLAQRQDEKWNWEADYARVPYGTTLDMVRSGKVAL